MMNESSELIVMLTYDDMTVPDAYRIFDECKDTKARIWGFKEKPLPIHEMKRLFDYMKRCGKMTGLEVVAYTESECIRGAKMAYECGCDFLMGTIFFDSVNDFCRSVGLKYMPFVGTVTDRPSILSGDIDDMIDEARQYIKKGVYGIDLLAYRYNGDTAELCRRFVAEVNAPVCFAGSVNSFERLDEIAEISPASFTIGSAFFDRAFGGTFAQQIDKVCEYMEIK